MTAPVIADAHKARIRAIRAAGGLASVDDVTSVSLGALKRLAGDLWEARKAAWSAKIVELCERHVGGDDAAVVSEERVTLVFHPKTKVDREAALLAVIADIREHFFGEPELDLSAVTGFSWREGEAAAARPAQPSEEDDAPVARPAPASAVEEAVKAPRAVPPEAFEGLDYGEDWRPTYSATWAQYALLDKTRVQHCLIAPQIENDLGGFDVGDSYYATSDTLLEIDIHALRAASARALRLYKSREKAQVFFTLNIESLRVSSFRERLWREVRQVPKPLLNKMAPILCRASPKLPAASAAEAIAHLRSFIPTVFMATSEASLVDQGGPYFPVQGYFLAAPPDEARDWRRVCAQSRFLPAAKEHGKRAALFAPLSQHDCAEAFAKGFDLVAVR